MSLKHQPKELGGGGQLWWATKSSAQGKGHGRCFRETNLAPCSVSWRDKPFSEWGDQWVVGGIATVRDDDSLDQISGRKNKTEGTDV